MIDFIERDVATVPENACLDNVFELLRRKGQRAVGVVDRQQRLLGYITPEHLAEPVMVQSSRSARAEHAFPSPRAMRPAREPHRNLTPSKRSWSSHRPMRPAKMAVA